MLVEISKTDLKILRAILNYEDSRVQDSQHISTAVKRMIKAVKEALLHGKG